MKTQGKLIDEKIIIEKPKEIGRLFNKSHFGKPVSGNKLELDLIESCFLLDEDKISITKDNTKISFEELNKKYVFPTLKALKAEMAFPSPSLEKDVVANLFQRIA